MTKKELEQLKEAAAKLSTIITEAENEEKRKKYKGKHFVQQTPPEYTESPLFLLDGVESLEDVALYGNRDFCDHIPEEVQKVFDACEYGDVSEVIEDFKTGGYYSEVYENAAEAVADYLPPMHKKAYTAEEVKEIAAILEDEKTAEEEAYCKLLELSTGAKWESTILRGCSQSDWIYCLYNADIWSGEAIENLETEYFNTGTEYIFFEDWDELNDGGGVCIYCHGWNEDENKKEIAAAFGVDISDILEV